MTRSRLPLLNLVGLGVILIAADLVPHATLLGVLACVPVLIAASFDDRRQLLLTGGVALAGFLLLAVSRFSAGAARPAPESLVPLVCIAAAVAMAMPLQARRMRAVAARETAQTASEMNRLLMSLLAHDLRSPLVLADQGFEYVEESVSGGYPIDRAMIADVRARLHRSLRAIEMVLAMATRESAGGASTADEEVLLRDEIAAEVASFAYEAEARGKRLVAELDAVPRQPFSVDTLVLRQGIAIVLDNAIRYADPGTIRVHARLDGAALEVRVEDQGPGLSGTRADGRRSGGSGLGLRLCAALLARAGGSLGVERDAPEGTVVAIRLPAIVAAAPAPARRHPVMAGV